MLALLFDLIPFHFGARCQPWTIVLSGVSVIASSWLILHSIVVTVVILLLICTWWYIFLLSYPKVWASSLSLWIPPPLLSLLGACTCLLIIVCFLHCLMYFLLLILNFKNFWVIWRECKHYIIVGVSHAHTCSLFTSDDNSSFKTWKIGKLISYSGNKMVLLKQWVTIYV